MALEIFDRQWRKNFWFHTSVGFYEKLNSKFLTTKRGSRSFKRTHYFSSLKRTRTGQGAVLGVLRHPAPGHAPSDRGLRSLGGRGNLPRRDPGGGGRSGRPGLPERGGRQRLLQVSRPLGRRARDTDTPRGRAAVPAAAATARDQAQSAEEAGQDMRGADLRLRGHHQLLRGLPPPGSHRDHGKRFWILVSVAARSAVKENSRGGRFLASAAKWILKSYAGYVLAHENGFIMLSIPPPLFFKLIDADTFSSLVTSFFYILSSWLRDSLVRG